MRVLTEKERNDFDGLWLQWDVDGNGVLDRDEFKMALKMLNLDSFDVNDIYDQVDRDGNGTIEKHEFAAWYFTDQVFVHSVRFCLYGYIRYLTLCDDRNEQGVLFARILPAVCDFYNQDCHQQPLTRMCFFVILSNECTKLP